jgi:long-chain acyl-CoA synthetase
VSPEPKSGVRHHAIGRTAAWLAKQVELGICDVELSLPQYRVLSLLDEGSAVSSALAERLAVRPPSVTSVIEGLVARGLVDRQPVADDRRRVSLALTDEGRQTLAAADAAASCRLQMIAQSLEADGKAERALADLDLWQQAFVAYHRSKATL